MSATSPTKLATLKLRQNRQCCRGGAILLLLKLIYKEGDLTMIRSNVHTEPVYQNYAINANHEGCYTRILDRIIAIHNYANQRRQRNIFTMLTFTIPQNQPFPEDIFSRFLEAFIRYLTRNGDAPAYFWVRERQTSNSPHWHLGLWISGFQHRSAYGTIQSAVHYWNRLFNLPDSYMGLVGWNATKPEIFLDNNAPDFYEKSNEVILWASYAAKCAEKSLTPRNARCYGNSCLQS